MADTTKEKILKINTQGAEKNVKSLKTQIRELKEQLAQLDKGTEEYNRVSKQLADTNQKQIEINEAMKYSNKDFGATLSNLTKVSAGVVGAISSVNSVMTLMGADSEEAQKAMMRIQSLMAIIQGMSAIDTAIKALKGLTVAFKDFNTVKGANAAVTVGAATSELVEAGTLADNTKEMLRNNDIAKAYDKANEDNAESTNKAADAIKRETELLTENRRVKSEGDTQLNTHILDEYGSKLQNLRGEYEELSMHSEIWDDDMAKLAGQIDAIEKLSQNYALLNYKQKAYTESIGQGADVEQKALKELGEAQAVLTGDFEKQLVSVRQRMDELDHLQDELGGLYSLDSDEGVKVMEKFNKLNIDGAEYVDRLEDAESALNAEITKLIETEKVLEEAQKDVIKYIPDQQLFDTVTKYNELKAEEAEIDKRNEETYKALHKARIEMLEAESNGMEDAIEKERQYQEMQAAFNETDDSKRLDEIYAELAGREELYKSYAKEIEVRKEKGVWSDIEVKQAKKVTEAENGETASLEANNTAKKDNAKSTEELADAEKKLGDGIQKREPILRKIGSGFKTFFTKTVPNGFKSLLNFVKLNPIFLGLSAIVAGIGYGISKWISAYNDAHKEAYELKKMNIELDMEFKKQKTDMEALLRMFYQENLTAKEKETLAKEINKLAGDELVARNKITGEWEIQIEKMQEYQRNLRTQIELEYHKKAILEAMDKEEEARQDANYEKNHFIGNLFRTETGYLKDAAEAVAEQEKHWKAIEKLTTNVVESIDKENKKLQKNTTGGGGVKKTFKELFNELFELYKKLYKQIASARETRKIFNGIYSEAIIAFDKIADIVNTNRFAHKLSDGFMKAFSNGLKGVKSTDITLDFIFGDNFTKLEEQLNQAEDKLKGMLKQTKISEKELLKQKTVVENLEKQLQVYNDIANAVLKYRQTVESTRQAELDRINAVAQYNNELDINMRYMEKQRRESRREFQYAELQKEIELNKALAAVTNTRLEEERQRIEKLRNSNLQNRETIEEIAELEKKIDEDQRTVDEARLNISNAKWQIRLTQLDEEYAKIQRNSEAEQRQLEIERTQTGGGVADFNTEVDLIEMQLKALDEYGEKINEFYEERKAKYAEDSTEWLLLEQERLAAQEALQDEYRAREIEKEQAQADRKLNIQKAYINTYQTISSEISNVLGEVMNKYDENSKEYLNLKYAQGVTDTISGSLAAFMSGVESGLPAPLNFILGGVLSASTLAVGIMQLANLKKGNLQNTSASTVDIGTEYDTLSYAQNSEIVGAIQDQRVYVVESDITSTQNRVQVAETQATF